MQEGDGRSIPRLRTFLGFWSPALQSGLQKGAAFGASALLNLAALGLVVHTTSAPERVGGAPVVSVTLSPDFGFMPSPSSPEEAAPEPAPKPRAEPLERTAQALEKPLLQAQRIATLPSMTPSAWTPAGGPAASDASSSLGGQGRGETAQAAGAATPARTAGQGAPTLGAQAADHTDAYEALVFAWIERNKHHPGDGATGIVTVRFTLDRRGRLREAALLKTSGRRDLDTVTLARLREIQPFPRPKPDAAWATRDFTVRIDYRPRRPV